MVEKLKTERKEENKKQEQKNAQISGSEKEKSLKMEKNKEEQKEQKKENILEQVKIQISKLKQEISIYEESIKQAKSKEEKNSREELNKTRKEILQKYEEVLSEIVSKRKEIASYESQISDENTGEYIEIKNKISDLEKRLWELDEDQKLLNKTLSGVKINEKLEKKDIDAMQKITVKEFLKKPYNERLKYVTIGNINSEDVANGTVKDLEINFTFNGKFNRQIYLSTTAGMILPSEVREVVVNGTVYSRSANVLKGEFFTENGKRLIIRDETKISISKLASRQDFETMQKNFEASEKELTSKYKDKPIELEIALEAAKRGIPEKVALDLILNKIKNIGDKSDRLAIMEDEFVDIERKKGEFHAVFGNNWKASDGKLSINFLSYLAEGDKNLYKNIAKTYGFKDDEIKVGEAFLNETVPMVYSGKLDLEKFASLNISSEDVTRIRSMKRFDPNSKEAVMLFKIAAAAAGLPESWATNSNLHYILSRESGGKVGILNYTMKGRITLEQFKAKALSSKSNNPFGVRSTASGLGQLLLSNIDIYYPSGRAGIGDPIEEAAGFMNYIKDRYGNPDVAASVYGKTGYFNHPKKGRQYKNFREGY